MSLYTEWYWQCDLHNLFRFLKLRMDEHAQREIRAYATTMFEITKSVCPAACTSFENHVLGSVQFSSSEWEIVGKLLGDDLDGALESAKAAGFKDKAVDRLMHKLNTGRQT